MKARRWEKGNLPKHQVSGLPFLPVEALIIVNHFPELVTDITTAVAWDIELNSALGAIKDT